MVLIREQALRRLLRRKLAAGTEPVHEVQGVPEDDLTIDQPQNNPVRRDGSPREREPLCATPAASLQAGETNDQCTSRDERPHLIPYQRAGEHPDRADE